MTAPPPRLPVMFAALVPLELELELELELRAGGAWGAAVAARAAAGTDVSRFKAPPPWAPLPRGGGAAGDGWGVGTSRSRAANPPPPPHSPSSLPDPGAQYGGRADDGALGRRGRTRVRSLLRAPGGGGGGGVVHVLGSRGGRLIGARSAPRRRPPGAPAALAHQKKIESLLLAVLYLVFE